MEAFLDSWRKVDRGIAALESLVLVILSLSLIFGVFSQGILRTFFDYNPLGISEFAVQSLVWVGFLSASLATHKRRHIVVDLIPQLFARKGWNKGAGIVRVCTALATFLFLLYLLSAAWTYWNSPGVQFRTSTILQIPTRYIALALLWGLLLMAIRFFQQSVEEFAHLIGKYPEEKRWVSESLLELKELLVQEGKRTPTSP